MEVYSPAEDSFLLARAIERENLQGRAVLEIGCGSGFLTEIAARAGANVTAVDINPMAVEATKKVLSEKKLAASVFLSDLFDSVDGKFDLIVFNPPYLPESEDEPVGSDERYSGGRTGRDVIARFIEKIKSHLKSDGKVLLLVSSLTGEQEVLSLFEKNGFSARAVERKKIEWEELIVLETERSL